MPGFRSTPKLPEFKLFDELTARDFITTPIWIDCHLSDFEQPWYDELDDEAFRPWTGQFPVPDELACLVSTNFTTSNDILLEGFIEHGFDERADADFPSFRPRAFLDEKDRIDFWHGNVYQFGAEQLNADMQKLQMRCNAELDAILPVHFSAKAGLLQNEISGSIKGFGAYSARNAVSFYSKSLK